MTDRGSVIIGLREVIDDLQAWDGITHPSDRGQITAMRERVEKALEVLEAQEPVEPMLDNTRMFRCSRCDNPVGYKDVMGNVFPHCNYCFKCGQAVKWG